MTETRCRQIVAERSRGVCEVCRCRRAAHFCHRKPRSQGGLWCPSNIYHGCPWCHSWETNNPRRAQLLGWRLWRSQDSLTAPLRLGGVLVLLDDEGGMSLYSGQDSAPPDTESPTDRTEGTA